MPHSRDMAFAFLQGAPLPIIAADSRAQIVFANDQALRLFAYSEEELLGASVETLIPREYHDRHGEYFQRYLREPTARVMGVGREVRSRDRNGREFSVEIGLTPVVAADGVYVVAAVADITVRKHLEREVTAAKLVQEAMLPRRFPEVGGYRIGGATQFADAAGGDFYDAFESDDGEVTLMIGDASGHGFAAALVSVAAKSYLRALSVDCRNLTDLLRRVNRLLVEELAEGRFVTLFVGRLDTNRRRFCYAGAGHAGYICSPTGELKERLISTGPPLGWFGDAEYTVEEIELAPDDRLLLMTDGIEESFGPDGVPFGRDRVFQALAAHTQASVGEQAQAILEAVHTFTCRTQHDDMTVLLTLVG